MSTDEGTRHRLRDWMTPARVAVLVLAVLALIFIFENTGKIRIRLLVPVVTMPLWGALLTTFVIGLIVGAFARRSARRRRAK